MIIGGDGTAACAGCQKKYIPESSLLLDMMYCPDCRKHKTTQQAFEQLKPFTEEDAKAYLENHLSLPENP